MLACLRYLLGGLMGVFRPEKNSSWRSWRGERNCWPCMRAASSAWFPQQIVLGDPAKTVVRVQEVPGRGDSRDFCPLPSHRSWVVLELAFAGPAPAGPKSGQPGGAGSDLPHGGREPDLGRTRLLRRVAQAGFDFSERSVSLMDETCSPEPQSCETMPGLSPKPPRGEKKGKDRGNLS